MPVALDTFSFFLVVVQNQYHAHANIIMDGTNINCS